MKRITLGLLGRLLVVVLAFTIMAAASCLFVINILHAHINREAQSMLRQAAQKIESDINTAETLLFSIAGNIYEIIDSGGDEEAVARHLQAKTESIVSRFDYSNIYAYFNVFGGAFIDGIGRELPGPYNPNTKLWYTEAVKGGGEIIILPVDLAAAFESYVMTYAIQMLDAQGQQLFVMALDVKLDPIIEFVSEMRPTKGSYGILEDGDSNIIAHPFHDYVGQNMSEVNADLFSFADDVRAGFDLLEHRTVNYRGESVVVFTSRLSNGWLLSIMMPEVEFYSDLNQMIIVIPTIGLIMAVVLIIILIRLDKLQKKTDKAAREQSDLLEMIWDNVESGIVLIDAKTLEVLDVNAFALRMYGGSKEDMVGSICNKFFGLHECPLLASDDPIYRSERPFIKADGTVIPVLKSAKKMQYMGRTVILESFDDISYIKEIENKNRMLDQSKNVQILLDSSPICSKLWSRDQKIISCNEECVRLFGVSSKEEFCERFFEFSPEYQPCGRLSQEVAAELIPKAFEEGYQRFNWLHKKANGDLMPTEVTLVRIEYEDDYVVAGYVRDLTEQNRLLSELEDAVNIAKEANQAKSSFLANMSHEMRTPLNVIIGLTDLHFDTENLPPEIQNDIKKINSAGNTLLSIVNDVLDISKIEAGKLELIPVQYETASFFNDIITLNMIRIESKPIDFIIDIDENTPELICGDELRLKQLYNNLLSNAFKYTREGSVTLRVSCERADDDLWMSVSVSDTGIGIKPDDLKKLFSEYNQVDTKANRKIEGTGLGLAITKKIVNLMDGQISVESEYGKGTTFYMKVKQGFVSDKPLSKEVLENLRRFRYTDTRKHVSAKIVREDMSYARVLIVDDVQTNLDVASGMMKKYRLQVDCVTSGQAAIDKIKRQEPMYNAIFMDHMMPEMDGIETTKRIRALDSEYAKKVIIISLTANAIAGSEQMFLDSGFQAFLSKPIDMMKLDMILKQWVRDKTKEAQIPTDSPAPESGYKPESNHTHDDIHIPGINTSKALALYGNDSELLISVIESYATNTPALIERLRLVTQENLPSYAIHVHGLKGASGNIGAEIVREKAAHLEMLSKAGDLEGVLAENDALLEDAQALVANINTWLNAQCSISRTQLPSPDLKLLKTLRHCCEQFDMSGVDACMEQLQRFCYEKDGYLIQWLQEKIDVSDFDAVSERIRAYEEESK